MNNTKSNIVKWLRIDLTSKDLRLMHHSYIYDENGEITDKIDVLGDKTSHSKKKSQKK